MFGDIFSKFANAVAHAAGKPVAFGLAALGIVVWAVSGPFFGFSETWQLVVNTSTTIITFLMVFVLQNTQNRDSEALHGKLDELILTSKAKNAFIGSEKLNESELKKLRELVAKAASGPDDPDAVEHANPAADPNKAKAARSIVSKRRTSPVKQG